MYRTPLGPQRSPGAPRAAGRFTSPSSAWGFPGVRSPYGGSEHRGGSPRGGHCYSPCSPGSQRGYTDGSPSGFRGGSPSGFRGGSPSGFRGGSRGFGGQMWRRSGGFRRPQSVSPASSHSYQSGSSDSPVERYFSPSMLKDPWAGLKPLSAADRQRTSTMSHRQTVQL